MGRILIILSLLISGCAAVPKPSTCPTTRTAVSACESQVQVVLLSKSTAYGMDGWRREAYRRFGRCVLVLGHGGTTLSHWCLSPDEGDPKNPMPICVPQDWIVACLRHNNPGVPIVLLSCNPDHAVLKGCGVFYAKSIVWTVPDREVSPAARFYRHLTHSDYVGNIDQLVEGWP